VVGALAAIIVLGLLYATVNDIPGSRVIVAVVASATLWAVLASQLLYLFRRSLGAMSAKVFAFLLAFVLAVAFGAWLIQQPFVDKLLRPFGQQ